MNAAEIRDRAHRLARDLEQSGQHGEVTTGLYGAKVAAVQAEAMWEIAAQMAELNERLGELVAATRSGDRNGQSR